MNLVFMFPGQSSRYPGMFDELLSLGAGNRATFERASELLGRPLAAHYRSEQAFETNRDVQVGVFLANHMFLQILEDEGVTAEASLGLSLGEWNHLVHIGALGFDEALLAVEERGRCYDAGPRGAMASVFPMEYDELREVVERAREGEVLEIVNLNSPRQQVMSGHRGAIDRALAILEDEHFVSVTVIEDRVPMHSSLFAPVGDRFRAYLAGLSFRDPKLPYLPNRVGSFVDEPRFVERLSHHVHEPVLWRKSIDFILDRWPDALLLEVGPKAVLTHLLDRKWHPGVNKASMDAASDRRGHLAEVIRRIREAGIDGAA